MPTLKIDAPEFSFTEVALAAGVSPKALRNWLDRKQILLDADEDREGDAKRRFSLVDVLRVSFVSRLVGYCVSIRTASELVEQTIITIAKRLRAFKNPPLAALMASYDPARFILYEDGDGYAIEFMPGETMDSRFIEKICRGSCTYLTIFPGPIVRKIVAKLGLDDEDKD